MHRFAVWAPRARVIDLVSDGRRIGMSPADGGWWESGDAAADFPMLAQLYLRMARCWEKLSVIG